MPNFIHCVKLNPTYQGAQILITIVWLFALTAMIKEKEFFQTAGPQTNTHNHCLVVRIDSNDKSIGDVALLPDAKMASCHGQDIHTPLCLPSINQVYYVLSITYYVLLIYVLSIPYIICVRRSNTLFTLN